MNTIIFTGTVMTHKEPHLFTLLVADENAVPRVDEFVVNGTDARLYRRPLEGERVGVEGSVSSSGVVTARRIVSVGTEKSLGLDPEKW